MTNALYQATVEELEALLSPRVVSRSLQEGLRAVGKTPSDVLYHDVEKLMKDQVFRQLQVTMAVTEAKFKIAQILEKLKTVEGEGASNKRVLENQEETLTLLQEKLRPFNLYFEWPEVQKLRAQLKLLEAEQDAGREASRVVQDARAQLRILEQKLEDQLVAQAQTLVELEAALEAVQTLESPKVRRLDSLVGQIKSSQDTRQLAPAEAERALKLASDLRKLVEEAPQPDAEDNGAEEATASAPSADLDAERRDLSKLAQDYAPLLAYRPDLGTALAAARTKLEAKTSVAESLEGLSQDLETAKQTQLNDLRLELAQIQETLLGFAEGVNTHDLEQTLQVLSSVVETTLPPLQDVQHLRSLYGVAQSRNASLNMPDKVSQEALEEQARALDALNATLERYQDSAELMGEVMALQTALAALQGAQAEQRLDSDSVSAARRAETELEAAAATQTGGVERTEAELRSLLSEAQGLPAAVSEEATQALEQVRANLLQALAAPESAEVEALRSELSTFKENLRNLYRERLDSLQKRADALNESSISSYIQSVNAELSEDAFPNLGTIEHSLQDAFEARRSAQLSDLHLLEQELEAYGGVELRELNLLRTKIAGAREGLERGELSNIEEIEALFEGVQATLKDQTADFLPRLDEALARYETVAKLNSEEAATAGMILRHLDSQRDALERVSASVRSELEASLQGAEALLEELENQLEATQSVANQLAGGEALDGFFDLFGDDSGGDGLFGDEPKVEVKESGEKTLES